MNARQQIVSVMTVLALSVGAWGQSGGGGGYGGGLAESDGAMPDAMNASCLLKVSYDPRVLPLSAETIEALLRSSGVAYAAWRAVFDDESDGDLWEVSFKVTSMQAPGDVLPLELPRSATGGSGMGGGFLGGMPGGATVRSADVQPGTVGGAKVVFGRLEVTAPEHATDLLAKVCENFRAALTSAHEKSLQHLGEQVKRAEEERELARQRLRQLQEQRKTMSGESEGGLTPSREMLTGRIQELRNEQATIEMELAGLQARREAIEKRIAELQAQAEAFNYSEHPEILPIKAQIKQLEHKMELVQTMLDKGVVPVTELEELKVQSAALKAEMEAARSRLQRELFTNQVDELKTMLSESAMREPELRSKAGFIEKLLGGLRQSLELADTYEMNIAIELPIARANYETAVMQLDALQRRMRTTQPPQVLTIGQ